MNLKIHSRLLLDRDLRRDSCRLRHLCDLERRDLERRDRLERFEVERRDRDFDDALGVGRLAPETSRVFG